MVAKSTIFYNQYIIVPLSMAHPWSLAHAPGFRLALRYAESPTQQGRQLLARRRRRVCQSSAERLAGVCGSSPHASVLAIGFPELPSLQGIPARSPPPSCGACPGRTAPPSALLRGTPEAAGPRRVHGQSRGRGVLPG